MVIFKRLMRVVDRPELGETPRYRTNEERPEYEVELDVLIESWTEQYPLSEVLHSLEEAHLPAGPIYSLDDIANDAQYRAREMLMPTHLEAIGTVTMPGLVPQLSETLEAI